MSNMATKSNRQELPAATGELANQLEGQPGFGPDQTGRALAQEVLDLPVVETATATRPKWQISPETRAKISAAKKSDKHYAYNKNIDQISAKAAVVSIEPGIEACVAIGSDQNQSDTGSDCPDLRNRDLKRQELEAIEAIYSQLDDQDRDIATRYYYGPDGQRPQTMEEIGQAYGRSYGWACHQLTRIRGGCSWDLRAGPRFKSGDRDKAEQLYQELDPVDDRESRQVLALRFGFDGHQPNTYMALENQYGHSWIWWWKRVTRLLAADAGLATLGHQRQSQKRRGADLELYHQLDPVDDQDARYFLAQRHGFDGHRPHSLDELGQCYDRSGKWAVDQLNRIRQGQRFIVGDSHWRPCFSSDQLLEARLIYDQLDPVADGLESELLALRYGFDDQSFKQL